MFTRYKGMGIPENYSGVRFREAAQTEMKTHKPSPSYTSTRTSVSPMFHSAQLQRNQGKFEEAVAFADEGQPNYNTLEETRNNEFGRENSHNSFRGNFGINSSDDVKSDFGTDLQNDIVEDLQNDYNRDSYNNMTDDENINFSGENYNSREDVYEKRKKTNDEVVRKSDENGGKNIRKSNDFKVELKGLLDKIFDGIKSEDFILLAVIFLLLGSEGNTSKSAILPLALLLLYS
ncbi:MAG: hypothetical protein IJC80_06650 [Clostridia bacterium]|nr:hypothetical protein [Clostridia bacterium]